MAEVFYGLGEALTSEGGLSMGILYLQLALYAKPDHAFALAALASAYETGQRYQDAIDAYDRIPPGTALQPAIDIRKAFDLNSLEKVDEAKKILDRLASGKPDRPEAARRAGQHPARPQALRRGGRNVYTAALKLIPKPDKRHWSIFYSRGTCYERLKNWPAAEADLQKALELYPDQPLALNYLGYSWIDQNRNLKQGMALIEKAVALKPDDGYIVDSLGWAHYKLGNYAEAVRFLERAVELKPQDPVLNDHLGDALWRVGREREAKFQWDQALTLDPEPEEMEKIKKKLAEGMPPAAEARAGPRETMRRVQAEEAQRDEAQPRARRVTPTSEGSESLDERRLLARRSWAYARSAASLFQGTRALDLNSSGSSPSNGEPSGVHNAQSKTSRRPRRAWHSPARFHRGNGRAGPHRLAGRNGIDGGAGRLSPLHMGRRPSGCAALSTTMS